MSYKIKEIQNNENAKEFEGIEIPDIEGVQIDFKTTKIIETSKKTGKVLSEGGLNYSISIRFNDSIMEDKELSESIKIASEMKFSIYRYQEKKYYFYTTDYTSKEKKIQILKNLLEVTKDYAEQYSKVEKKESELLNDYKKEWTIETRDLLMMPYTRDGIKPLYIVCAKNQLNKDDYIMLARAAYYKGYLTDDRKSTESVSELVAKISDVTKYFSENKKKMAFFIISDSVYNNIKENIISIKAKEEFINQEYARKGKTINMADYEILDENPFGISNRYDKEKGVFVFTGKGYVESSYVINNSVVRATKGLISLWAENFIYSEYLGNGTGEKNKFYLESCQKIELNMLKGGSAKSGYEVSIDDREKIKKIKENLNREMQLWGREELLIDIKKSINLKGKLESQYPVIYISDKKSYLVYSMREKVGKIPEHITNENMENIAITQREEVRKLEGDLKEFVGFKNVMIKGYTLKGFELDIKEVRDFLENHPYANQIRENTKILTAKVVLLEKEYQKLFDDTNYKQKLDEILESTLLKLEMNNELPKESVKVKKLKF